MNEIPQEKDPLAVRIYHLEVMLESSSSDEAWQSNLKSDTEGFWLL
jgi:hypothetical protein